MKNFNQALILNHKKLQISDDEALILLITYALVEQGTSFVNPDNLSFYCSFSPTKIDVIYSSLTAKKYIETKMLDNGSVITVFTELEKKLMEVSKPQGVEDKGAYYEYMQEFFQRTLSPLEYEVIQSWMEKGYSLDLIKASCAIAIKTGNKSIRYIDMIIFEENKKAKLGPEEYTQSQQETVDISAIDWLDDDE